MASPSAALVLFAAVLAGAQSTFISTWKSTTAGPVSFTGRKVAALVIVDDESLRMSAEEALAREITTRGPTGVAAYRLIPREELTDKEKAKAWFDKAEIQGAVVLRLVATDTQKVYSAVIWGGGYYANAWDYYGYGWATAYPIGKGRNETTITVETVLYDLATANPIWAGVSRTTNPKDVASFMKQLAAEVVESLEKEGLVRRK